MRANVYVDGFNLYYGSLRGETYRWLDLEKLASRLLRPTDSIGRIRYFTARVNPTADDPQVAARQSLYLRAVETLPSSQIHFGQFLTSERVMQRADGMGSVRVLKTEEKGPDVNLATHLLLDSFHSDFEVALVISNDSDLAEPIRRVREEFGVPVGVALPVLKPNRHPSKTLREVATFVKRIRSRRLLRESQFPDVLSDAGGEFRKPDGW